MRDRRRYLRWVFEARNVLAFGAQLVTSNHLHLLLRETGSNVIPQSMHLIAGRTAQEYNMRKERKGGWEDRYHAT